jgi:hypothetical protein
MISETKFTEGNRADCERPILMATSKNKRFNRRKRNLGGAMAAQTKDFDFKMPLVKTVSSQGVKKVVSVGKTSAQPTKALRLLMSGKLVPSPKR